MQEIDYRKLMLEAKKFFSLEWNYNKLTAVEKLTILLSATAFLAVIIIICTFALHHIFTALVTVLAEAMHCYWGAHLIAAGVLLLVLLLVVAFKTQLIVNPIARFLSKLFLKPNDNNE